MLVVKILSLIFIVIGIILLIIINIFSNKNNNKPKQVKSEHNFCFLIPARYESNVIEGLLKSIKNQSFKINMNDVYVIVEDIKDKTVDICSKYNATVVLRNDLSKQRKGYALDDAVKYILNNKKHYDAYFIFDADNILDKNYIKNMIDVYDKGYDIASGYRNCKNGNKSVVASSSALTFSLVNTVFNTKKNKKNKNITFSGTGFYIRGNIIEKLKGYPFHSLTEDYELSLYATLNNLTTYYNTNSIFYDEQPVKFKDTVNQRQRWIRGYFDVRKMYVKKIFESIGNDNINKGSKIDETIGIIPYIFMIIGLVIYFISLLVILLYNLLINEILLKKYLLELIIFLILIYLILFIMTLTMIVLENNKIDLTFKSKIKTLFYNPLFMMSYITCAISALTKKEIKWTRTKHGS